MSARFGALGSRPSLSVVSAASLISSAAWFVSACVYLETSALRSDWSGTPLAWVLTVLLTPPVCFACGMILVDARQRQRYSLMEWWALVAAFLPVTLGTLLAVWVAKVLLMMSRSGL